MSQFDKIFSGLPEVERNRIEGIGDFCFGKKTWPELNDVEKKAIMEDQDLISPDPGNQELNFNSNN